MNLRSSKPAEPAQDNLPPLYRDRSRPVTTPRPPVLPRAKLECTPPASPFISRRSLARSPIGPPSADSAPIGHRIAASEPLGPIIAASAPIGHRIAASEPLSPIITASDPIGPAASEPSFPFSAASSPIGPLSAASTPTRSDVSEASGATLQWDNNVETTKLSTNNQQFEISHSVRVIAPNMVYEGEVKKALTSLCKARILYENHQEKGVDSFKYKTNVLDHAIEDLNLSASLLSDVRAYFEINPPEDSLVEKAGSATTLLNDIRTLITKLCDHLYERSKNEREAAAAPPAAAPGNIPTGIRVYPVNPNKMNDATRQVKLMRLEATKTTDVPRAGNVEELLYAITRRVPESDSHLLEILYDLEELQKEASELFKRLDARICDAMELDEVETSTMIQETKNSLDKQLLQTRDYVREAELSFGLKTKCTTSKHKAQSLTVPEFSGEKGLDYFTFKQEFIVYIGSIPDLTNSDRLEFLKKKCLKGLPAAICLQETTIEKCWDKLSERYGNIPMIFNKYKDEFFHFGRCPYKDSERTKQADWLYKVQAKLLEIEKFATNNDVTNYLYTKSDIHTLVQQLLNRERQIELGRRFQKFKTGMGLMDEHKCFEECISYLTEQVSDISWQLSTPAISLPGEDKTKKVEKQWKDNKKEKETVLSVGAGNKATDKKTREKSYGKEDKPKTTELKQTGDGNPPIDVECRECEGIHSHFYFCKKFLDTPIKERPKLATANKVCHRCLRMDSRVDLNDLQSWWDRHANDCRTDHFCNLDNCGKVPHRRQRHILCCSYHQNTNKKRLNNFKSSFDSSFLPSDNLLFIDTYTALPDIENQVTATDLPANVIPDVENPGIFMCQELEVTKGGPTILLFYDSGCGSACLSTRAVSLMDTREIRPGPTTLNVAGGKSIYLEYGDRQFELPMAGTDKRATISGIQMDHVTTQFPVWELTEAYNDIVKAYGRTVKLPTVPKSVGGSEVDLLLGSKYNYLFPTVIAALPSGLCLYESRFAGVGGHRGVLGGPHEAWRLAAHAANFMGSAAFLTCELRAYQSQKLSLWSSLDWSVDMSTKNMDVVEDMAGLTETQHSINHAKMMERQYFELEGVGTEAPYRCINCRGCPTCKKGNQLEHQSLKEEREDEIISQSVKFTPDAKTVVGSLPFICDPDVELGENHHVALAILKSQMKQLQGNPEKRQEVLKSHNKLVENGYSCKVSELPPEIQLEMEKNKGCYYLPWRTVHKEGSLSTPVRTVFDASSNSTTGKSLNNCLAKGSNRLEKILNLLVNFRSGVYAFCCDIKMAYNQIKLDPKSYRWHKYLWIDELDPNKPVEERCMLTIIYGVISSGNQTTEGITQVANYCKLNHPEYTQGAEVLIDKCYVDDANDAMDTLEDRVEVINGINFTLDLANMEVKSFVLSGQKPDEKVSSDGVNVSILGYTWAPEEDVLSLEEKPLYFGKCKRGKRPDPVSGDLKEALRKYFTKRTILSLIARCFDPLGLLSPVTGNFKLDYREIIDLQVGWDDGLPEKYLDKWVKNLELMQQLQKIKFPRSAAGKDGVDLIISVDASKDIAIACAHARYISTDGEVTVKLIAGKSKIITGSTIPRAELKAAVMGAVLSRVVINNYRGKINNTYFISDSTVVLSWLNQDSRPMSIGVRNAVVEILRFSSRDQWYHVDTALNVADTGTRPGVTTEDIGPDSTWQRGKEWMYLCPDEWPIKKVQSIQLTKEDKEQVGKEIKTVSVNVNLQDELVARYEYGKYVIDPNRYGWWRTIQACCYLRRFGLWLLNKSKNVSLPGGVNMKDRLSSVEIKAAEDYFFRIGTAEVKRFTKSKDISGTVERDGIIYYTGRILDGQNILDPENVFPDLRPLTFVRPVLDRYSPISYAIMKHVHENLVNHRGTQHTLLESRYIAFIIGGRNLAKEIRLGCQLCIKRKARMLEVKMGPVHENRITVAPPFFNTQVDLCGPFIARCEHNHRSSVKVWAAIFRDPGSGALAAHIMQDYSTEAFLQCFSRFCHNHCVPDMIYIDPGSQLKSACDRMELNVARLTRTLNGKFIMGIKYQVGPTGGSNYQGVVERSIAEVKKLFFLTFGGVKLSILAYETALSFVCNELNNLPICIGSKTSELDHIDLITPSRLMFGRASNRSLTSPVCVDKPTKLLAQLDQVYESWWKVWTTEKIADYIPKAARFDKTTQQPKIGDVVVFCKCEGEKFVGNQNFKLGIISEVFTSKDGVIRSVMVEYKNASEAGTRQTRRPVRNIAIIVTEDELTLPEILNQAAKKADLMYLYKGDK